ncbi:MAG TPA: protein translocase subunit SecD [Actinomycetota bacterium]|nr:protein translocase subunit SecD [Actinomycetota bacterium]
MKTRRYKIMFIVGLIVSFGGLGGVIAAGASPKLGLDLEGGISVILQATGEEVRPDVLDETVNLIRDRIDALGVAEPEVSVAGNENVLIQLPGVEDEEAALELIGTTAQLTFRQVKAVHQAGSKRAPEITEEVDSSVNDKEVVYPSADPDDNTLYTLEPANGLTGTIVEDAEAVPVGTNQWTVSIEMNGQGADLWEDFTDELACLRDEGETVRSQVAIVLDGKVESAAGMQDPATSPQGGVECGTGIAGGETSIDVGNEREAKDLALVLTTGALPITLEQQEVRKVSPTLGRESLNTGLTAGAVGLGLVAIYVLLYYRTLGLVIWLGFLQFTALVYTMLAILGETNGLSLTLAGVAGIIVSIGIAADSFIVAFERLKDEVRSGKSLRAAVQRGSDRAIKTILVADFVTGIGAVILFFLAVGPVRGFALTLGLSTAVDVLLAYFLIRPAMVLLGRTKHLGGAAVGARDTAEAPA